MWFVLIVRNISLDEGDPALFIVSLDLWGVLLYCMLDLLSGSLNRLVVIESTYQLFRTLDAQEDRPNKFPRYVSDRIYACMVSASRSLRDVEKRVHGHYCDRP
jgi:hypothetical protein